MSVVVARITSESVEREVGGGWSRSQLHSVSTRQFQLHKRFKTFIFFFKNIFQNFFQTFRADFLGNFWGRAQVLLLFLGLVKTGTKAGESQRDQGFWVILSRDVTVKGQVARLWWKGSLARTQQIIQMCEKKRPFGLLRLGWLKSGWSHLPTW